MTLWHRRILYIIFILLFFILAPAISFYAAGYEFDFNSGKVQRTGILIIESEPKGASIDLGDKKKYNWFYDFFYKDEKMTTPNKLRNLLPDEYEITLSKEGYYDYRRKVEINPGQTVILDDPLLFKKAEPQLIDSNEVLGQGMSPDKNKLAAVAGENLLIIDLSSGQTKKIPLDLNISIAQGSFEIIWSPSNKKVALTLDDYPVFNVENGRKEIEARNYFSGRIDRLKWDSFSDNKIYVQRGNIIHQLNIAQKNIDLTINKGSNSDFMVESDNLYTTQKEEDSSSLLIYDLNKKQLIKKISIPPALNYIFLNAGQKLIYLYNEKHCILYTIDPWSIFPLQDSISNLRDFFLINSETMLYWNDYEVWLYDIGRKNKTLLMRISERIDKAIWHPDNNHLIYNTAGGINAIELKDWIYLSAMQILDWRDTSETIISPDSRFIYFTGWLDSGRNLYKLEIK